MYDDARHQEAGNKDDYTQHTRLCEGRGKLEAGIFGTTAALIGYENVPSGKNEGNYDARRKENDRKYENWKPNLYIWEKSIYHGNFKRDTGFLFGRWKV